MSYAPEFDLFLAKSEDLVRLCTKKCHCASKYIAHNTSEIL